MFPPPNLANTTLHVQVMFDDRVLQSMRVESSEIAIVKVLPYRLKTAQDSFVTVIVQHNSPGVRDYPTLSFDITLKTGTFLFIAYSLFFRTRILIHGMHHACLIYFALVSLFD